MSTTPVATAERRSADLRPTICGQQRIEKLVIDVEVALEKRGEEFSETMNLIEQLHRLGIAYHFETKIVGQLDEIYENSHGYFESCRDDLHAIALLFRLLRQQGHRISCKVFDQFKDGDNFRESLHSDICRLLSIYEAGHLKVHGEDILEEALAFTTSHLKSIGETESCCSNDLVMKLVKHALTQPIHKGLQWLVARHYITIYKDDSSHDEALLASATLDFNSLQEQHQKELGSISWWWKRLDFGTKQPFARDRIVEFYFWILGVFFEPEFALARRIPTKVIFLTSVMDDIYNVYGTIWDCAATDALPEYVQVFYEALLDVYAEIHDEMKARGQGFFREYAIQVMKDHGNAYFEEANWYHRNHTPLMEEYMAVALVSSGYYLLSTISFVCMGDIVMEHAFEGLFDEPKMVKASRIIARLMDDILSHEDGNWQWPGSA